MGWAGPGGLSHGPARSAAASARGTTHLSAGRHARISSSDGAALVQWPVATPRAEQRHWMCGHGDKIKGAATSAVPALAEWPAMADGLGWAVGRISRAGTILARARGYEQEVPGCTEQYHSLLCVKNISVAALHCTPESTSDRYRRSRGTMAALQPGSPQASAAAVVEDAGDVVAQRGHALVRLRRLRGGRAGAHGDAVVQEPRRGGGRALLRRGLRAVRVRGRHGPWSRARRSAAAGRCAPR